MEHVTFNPNTREVTLRLSKRIYPAKAVVKTLEAFSQSLPDALCQTKTTHYEIRFKAPQGANAEFIAYSIANHCLAETKTGEKPKRILIVKNNRG